MNLFCARSATVVAPFWLVASSLVVAPIGAAYAAAPVTQTLSVADLTPCCGNPVPDATGIAQSNSLSKADVGQADIFSSRIIIPSSTSSTITIATSASDSSADIRVVLSRGGLDYAECFPVREHDGPDDHSSSGGSSTFAVDIVKVTFHSVTVFKQVQGRCDVDLSTGGIQPGVPAVQAGDVATASSVVNSIRTDFLSGIFVQP